MPFRASASFDLATAPRALSQCNGVVMPFREGFNKHKIRHVGREKICVKREEIFGKRVEINISTRFSRKHLELYTFLP